MNPNKRRDGESFKQYRKRLKSEQAVAKHASKGRILWYSSADGTYVREKHGELR